MRIVVRTHEDIEPELRRWRRSLGGSKPERDRRAAELWGEFVHSVVTADGVPPDAIAGDRPDRYWCAFPSGGLAHLWVRPHRRVGLFTVEREVVVVGLVFSPGLPG